MAGPLSGFKIVDVSTVISGPHGTQLLADQGAEVIKVENPLGGDHTREHPNQRGGLAANYLNNNRNKRSVAINLKHPRGLAALMRLVESADVLVQNFRPGVAERIGIDEGSIRKVAPEIVYVSISGFGETGPYASKPVYDPLVQAVSGLTTIQAGSDDARPRLVRTIVPDKLTAIVAAQAITAALLSRQLDGKGQHVRLSMLDAVISFLWGSDMGSQTFLGAEFPQEEAASFIDLIYETTDGYISVAVQTDSQWRSLTRALGRPEWLEDERFKTAGLRQQNIDKRLALTQEVLKTSSADEWLKRLEDEGVPCAPVLTRGQMITHPQVAENGIVVETEHPVAGPLRQARAAARFSRTPTAIRRGAPRLGEDTAAVLKEAGYSDEEIRKLAEDGAVAVLEREGV